ncbi:MAG: glutamate carboxypeptidase, partial [Natronomonas sp.]
MTPADGSASGESVPSQDRRIHEWAVSNRERVETYLLGLVETETPTETPETFDPFFERLAEDFEAVGLRTERVPGEETG